LAKQMPHDSLARAKAWKDAAERVMPEHMRPGFKKKKRPAGSPSPKQFATALGLKLPDDALRTNVMNAGPGGTNRVLSMRDTTWVDAEGVSHVQIMGLKSFR